jgi:sensor histidine kinase YesM
MIIPLMIIFGIMGYLVMNAQQNDFKKIGVNSLTSINDNIVNIIYSSIHQQDVTMRNAQYMISMKKLMSHDILVYRDIIFMNSIINYLTSAQTSYRYIDSIYLYMDGLDNFLSSSSDELASFTSFYDTEWYDHYRKIPKDSNQFVETREVQRHSYDTAKEVITIYKRMSYAKGVIVLNVKSDNFGERLKDMLNPGQSFFFLNKDGEVLYRNNKQTESIVNLENDFFGNITKEYDVKGEYSHNQKWIEVNKEYYLINVMPDDNNQTYLVSMISFDAFTDNIRDFIRLALAILMINFLIVMLLAWITTKSAFKHITYLVDVFSAAERGEEVEKPQLFVRDEYNLILNNILFLFIKNNQMQSNLMEKQHQNQISELMALQMQINPHFIFNTLQTMDLEVLKELGGQSTLHTLIQELSSIMKYALTDPTELVSLKEELNYLKAYIEIQEVRFNNNIVTYYEIDDSLLEYSVFRLMLQPIIENSVNHGIRSSNERCCIKIRVYRIKDDICFDVIDNGVGMTKNTLNELKIKINDAKSKNIGLTNLNRRLILRYGEYSRLKIQSKKDMGTVIRFKIPIEEMERERMIL